MVLEYFKALRDRRFRGTALRVALLIGTLLFLINHGSTLLKGQMSQQNWISALLTYFVPYCVSVHGQFSREQ